MKKLVAILGLLASPCVVALPLLVPHLAFILALFSAQLSILLLVVAFAILLLGNPGPAGGPGTLAVPLIF